MSLFAYTFVPISLPGGLLGVTLYHPEAGLTPPARAGIVSLSPFTERIEILPGRIETASLEIELGDALEAQPYPNGFWRYALHDSLEWNDELPEFRFTLDQGSGATHLFWGTFTLEGIEWEERLRAGQTLRICRARLVSVERKIENVSFADLAGHLLTSRALNDDQLSARPAITSIVRGGDASNDGITYTYRIAARTADAEFEWGPAASITSGPMLLNGSSYISLQWTPVGGALSYAVYRTHDGSNSYGTGFIGATQFPWFDDTGFVPEGVAQSKRSNSSFVALSDIILSLVELAFEQPYHPGALTVRNCDIRFLSALGEHTIETVYVLLRANKGTLALPQMEYAEKFDPENDRSWAKRFRSPYDIIGAVCRNFGIAARHLYNDGFSRHELELFTRGRNSIDALTMLAGHLSFRESGVVPASGVKVFRTADPEHFATAGDVLRDGALEVPVEFVVQTPAPTASEKLYAMETTSIGFRFHEITGVKFFHHGLDAWITETSPLALQAALARYLQARFTKGNRRVNCSYASLLALAGGSPSHSVIVPGARSEINGRFYYANEVAKDPAVNECAVEWIEE